MISHPRPLIGVFAEMPDFRSARGKRHPLAAILALTCNAMLCGARSYTALAAWGRNDGARLMQALGFTRRPPCAATLYTVASAASVSESQKVISMVRNSSIALHSAAWACSRRPVVT